MEEKIGFDIAILFKLILLIIFIKEIKNGFFKGFWKTIKEVIKDFRWIIAFYLTFVFLIMLYVDAEVVSFWQTKAFQMKRFYYPGVLGNHLGNGEYIYSILTVVILVAKIFGKEEIRRKFSLALTTSIVSGMLNSFIKIIVRRERPDIYGPSVFKYRGYLFSLEDNIKYIRGDYSMPSGHTTVSAAAFITLGILTKNKFLKGLYFTLPLITAFGRTYFSKHWVSDVSVSILVGIIFSHVIYRLYNVHKESI